MEIGTISKRILSAILAIVLGAACATARGPSGPSAAANGPSAQPSGSPGFYGPQETYGPPAPSAPGTQPVYGPEPMQLRPVYLVLGPGGARAFADIGVLRALNEAKIPIAAIYGTEMGALIGALYSYSGGKMNRFEWSLQKFNQDEFINGKSLIPNPFEGNRSERKLNEALSKTLDSKSLRDAPIPVRIGVLEQQKDQPVVVAEGPAKDAIEASLAPATSAARAQPFLITEAKSHASGPVIVVDTRPRSARSVPEIRDADLVIQPDLKGITEKDYQKKSEAAYRGKNAVSVNLKEIRRLVGLPQDGSAP